MSSLLARIARTLTHHWKRGLAGAIVVVVLLGAAAGAGGEAADDFNIPGTESQQALDLFKKHSPAFAGADSTLVFTVEQGKITDPAPRAAVTGALDKVRELKGVQVVEDPFAKGGTLSRDGRLASVAVRYSTEPQDLKKPDGEALVKAAETGESNGVSVAERGILIDLASEQTAPVGELIGVAIAILLLTLLFRSLAAMAVTLVGALIGVVVGQILLAALAAPLDLPAFATVIAVMLGLGAGIDYSLLIIARVREQMAAGDSVRDASAKAAATAGSSVVAAGLIVMVAIAGLLVIGIPLIGKLGIAAALGVGGGRRVGADDPADHDRGVREAPQAEEARARRALATRSGAGARSSPRARGSRSPPACSCCSSSRRPSRSCASASPTTATSRPSAPSASPTTSSARPSARARTARSCSPSTRRRATPSTKAAAREPAEGRRRHQGRRRRRARDAERGRRDGDDHRRPHHRAAGRQDERPARAPARRRDPEGDERHAAEGLRRRPDAGLRGLLRQGRLAPAAVHRRRHRPVGAAADRRLPLAVDPARLGGLQPALGRRRLRRRRGRVPGGRRREPDRRRQRRADRVLHPGDAVRDPVRAEHGLQRLPALADPRGLQRGRRRRARA